MPLRRGWNPRRDYCPFGLAADLIGRADGGEIPMAWRVPEGVFPPRRMVLNPYTVDDQQTRRRVLHQLKDILACIRKRCLACSNMPVWQYNESPNP
jgi:hypothetical protein